jgi:hypothetical protein
LSPWDRYAISMYFRLAESDQVESASDTGSDQQQYQYNQQQSGSNEVMDSSNFEGDDDTQQNQANNNANDKNNNSKQPYKGYGGMESLRNLENNGMEEI